MTWSTQGEHWAAEAGACLVAECEAFLSGSFAKLLSQRGEEVPVWAWLSQIAHAEAAEVARLATEPGSSSHRWRRRNSWEGAVAAIAASLRASAGADPAALARLQARLLAQLEIALMAGRLPPVETPAELTRIVLAALRRPQRTSGK